MPFCPECERVVTKSITHGTFFCYCGYSFKITDENVLIESSENIDLDYKLEKYNLLVKNAPHTNDNAFVLKDCMECGRNNMAILIFSDENIVIWKCKCGYQESNNN